MVYKNLDRESFMKKVRKMSDEEFIPLYEKGLSDGVIGKMFGITHGTVRDRRQKIGFIANYPGPMRTLNKEEIKEAFLSRRKDTIARNKRKFSEDIEFKKKCYLANKGSRSRNLIKYRETERKYRKKWGKENPEKMKVIIKKYETQPRVVSMRRDYSKKYWQRNYVKIRDGIRKGYIPSIAKQKSEVYA